MAKFYRIKRHRGGASPLWSINCVDHLGQYIHQEAFWFHKGSDAYQRLQTLLVEDAAKGTESREWAEAVEPVREPGPDWKAIAGQLAEAVRLSEKFHSAYLSARSECLTCAQRLAAAESLHGMSLQIAAALANYDVAKQDGLPAEAERTFGAVEAEVRQARRK